MRWVNEFVEIPSDTPEDQIPAVAEAAMMEELEKSQVDVAFVGVYHIPEVEEEEDET